MAPIKFEEQLKDKLEKRTLSPSSESWSKLSERLDADKQRSKNPIFWWLSMAAGLIVMIAITVQFFNADESEKVVPQVVEEKAMEEKLEDKIPELDDKKSMELVTEISLDEKKEKPTMVKDPQLLDYKKVTNQKSEPKTQLTDISKTVKNSELNKTEGGITQLSQKENDDYLIKNAVADALKTLKTENTAVTDKEIDSLLKLASKELFKEKLREATSKTVDASALLMSVEDEMGQSFRSRVFEALKESYTTIRTAVAERNY
jgi:hypothetical protein